MTISRGRPLLEPCYVSGWHTGQTIWNNRSLTIPRWCLNARMLGKNDLTGKTFLSQLLTVSHAEPGADPPRAGGIAWQIRNRDLNAPSAPVRAREGAEQRPTRKTDRARVLPVQELTTFT